MLQGGTRREIYIRYPLRGQPVEPLGPTESSEAMLTEIQERPSTIANQ